MLKNGTGRIRAPDPAEVAVERQVVGGRRPRGRRRARRPRIAFAPRLPLLGVPSSSMSAASIAAWSAASSPSSAGAIVSTTFATAFRTPLPPKRRLVAVAQLDGLVGAGRGAGRDGGPADRAVGEDDVDLDRRVAPRVEDLAGVDVVDDRVAHFALTARRPVLEDGDPGQLATLEELERGAAAGADVGHPVGEALLLDGRDRVAAADDDGRAGVGHVGQEPGHRPRALGERRDLEDAERSVPEDGLRRLEGLLHGGEGLLADVDDVPRGGDLLGRGASCTRCPG